ncbi:hypothetical protein CKO31_18535 [Thiohalocapsa halophila]|uniref:Uncharacterized protein n=1 Tax=Thiohalocapsa halophila TaxID=69359 RepID=A0ABS1CLA2_9GAMM|nr:hypothetical protein [Thiohalocapsa halophila]MBK1632705.1 hypothetical protein [Thiohalocapsa halophila]
MRHPVSSTLALLLAAGLAALPASAAQAQAQQSAAADRPTQASGGSGKAEPQSTADAGDSSASAAGKTQPSGSQGGGSGQSKAEQGGSGDGMDTAGGASGDSASEQKAVDKAAAGADQRHSFSGLVLGVQPVRINADGDAHLLGRVLLDDGRMALVNFGNLKDLMKDQRSAGTSGGQSNRGPVRSGQRIAGTGTLDQQRGEPMLVVEQWRLIGHPASAGRPPMYMHPQVPGRQGMAMSQGRANRPGPMQHPSWAGQPGQQAGMSTGAGQMQRRPGMANAPSVSGRGAGDRSMTTDMDLMLTGTVLGVGTDDAGDAQAQEAAEGQSQQTAQAQKAPRRIRVSGPQGMEVVADLGSSKVARELSLAQGDQVVLYGEAGMEQGQRVLMTHYVAKLVALPRRGDAGKQGPASGKQATQTGTDGRSTTTAGVWPERGTPRSVITNDES